MNLNLYLSLALVLLLGLLSSKAMKLVRLPNVTGYLIVGIIMGPYCLKLLSESTLDTLSIIPEIALGFIAFSIGAEFKLSYLKQIGPSPVIIAFLEGFGAMILVDAVLILCGYDISFALALGAIASATAPAATLMVVRQYKAKGPVTSALLSVVAIDDAVAIIGFGVSMAIAKVISLGGAGFEIAMLLEPLKEIFGAIALGALAGLVLTGLTKWFTGRGNRLSCAVCIIFLCLGVSVWAGFSTLLACMTMSCFYVNMSKEYEKVFELVDRMTPPIFTMFFVVSGATLKIGVLPSVGFVGVIYIIVRVIGKYLGALAGAKISKAEPVVAKYLGLALVPQAGVAIGLASVALRQLPAFGVQIQTVVLCATVIYELIGPVVTKLALKGAGEIQETGSWFRKKAKSQNSQ
ncbi:MAG TPA: cation:proton antiporter [Clostridia bacterium]